MENRYDKSIRAKVNKANNLSAKDRAAAAFSAAFSNIEGALRGHGTASVERLSIRQRQAGDYIAVAAGADNGDGGPVVAFGSGRTMWSALAALNGAIARGEWKEDRYRVGQGGGEKPLAPVVSSLDGATEPLRFEQGELFGLASNKDP